MTYKDRATDIQTLLGQGKGMDAFEKYYHNDVVMIEPVGGERVGKDANRKYEENFFSNIAQMHGGGIDAITADEKAGITMVESWMDVSFKDGSRVKWEQVARQKWQGDQIIEERFYYNAPEM